MLDYSKSSDLSRLASRDYQKEGQAIEYPGKFQIARGITELFSVKPSLSSRTFILPFILGFLRRSNSPTNSLSGVHVASIHVP